MKIVSKIDSSNDVVSRDFVNSYATTQGTNAYSITLVPIPTSLAFLTGQAIRVHVQSTSTGVISLSVNGLTAKPVMLSDGTQANTWRSGSIYTVVYNGSNFIQQGEGGVVANGAVQKDVKYDETITANDVIEAYYQDLMVNNSLIADANVSGGTYNFANAWSPDGTFLAVGTSVAPYILVFKRSGDTLTQLAAQTTAGGVVYDISWSPDSVQFTVRTDASPYIYTYRRLVGDTFERITMTAATTDFAKWSPTNEFVATTHSATPFFRLYKRATTGFTLVSSPITALPSAANAFAWSPDGTYFALTYGSTPGSSVLRIYQRSTGDTFTQVGSSVSLPNFYLVKDVQWSLDNFIAVVGTSQSPTYPQNFAMYQFASGTLSSVSVSSITIPDSQSCAWHPSGTYLAIANTNNSPYVTILKKSGTTFTNLSSTYSIFNPVITHSTLFPTNPSVSFINWSNDGNYLTFTSDNHSDIAFYRFASTTVAPYLFRKVTPATSTVGKFDKVYGVAKESGTAGQTKKASILVGGNLV